MKAVQALAEKYPHYSIKVTGHSLGAALAHLTAMMLANHGFEVSLTNFGQPRVGDKAFSEFTNDHLKEYWRQTHHQDIVPQVPQEIQGFRHSHYEVYEENHTYTTCNKSGEDRHCSNQWWDWQLSVDDHLLYMNQCIGGDCG